MQKKALFTSKLYEMLTWYMDCIFSMWKSRHLNLILLKDITFNIIATKYTSCNDVGETINCTSSNNQSHYVIITFPTKTGSNHLSLWWLLLSFINMRFSTNCNKDNSWVLDSHENKEQENIKYIYNRTTETQRTTQTHWTPMSHVL